MDLSLFKKEFCSAQIGSNLMWGLLFAFSVVSLNLMLGQIEDYVHESEMMALSATASIKAKNVLKEVPMTPARAPEETDSIIVKYKDSVSDIKKASIEKGEKLKKKSDIPQINVVVYDVDENDTGREVAERMKLLRKADIEYVEVDMMYAPSYIPNDPYYSSEWHLPKIQADVAWDTTKGSGIIIGIGDSGVNCAHADLAANCVAGWNFWDNNSNATDVYGHGTAVSATAASIGENGIGGAGVAYQSKIMPLRVSDSTGWGLYSHMITAITYAADHGVRVMNLSFAPGTAMYTLESAAQYMRNKGGVVVYSGGNSGTDLGVTNSPYITNVSATQSSDDAFASWSSFGNHIDVSAPGYGIYCIWGSYTSYASCWGTSFSAPITAGLYALMFSANPTLTPSQADNILFSTADDLGEPGWDQYYGWGRVNAARAVAMAASTTGGNVADTQAPTVPQNLTAGNITASAVTLTWGASIDNVGVSGYDVYRNGTLLTTVTGTSYTNSGLSGNTTYSYTVAARDAAGNQSSQTGAVAVNTADAPLAIVSSAVTVKTGTTATVAVTTSKAATITVKYGLTATALTGTATSLTTGTSHTVSLTGLKVKSKYFYQVTATDASGATATSPVSNFRTGAR